MSSLAPGIWRSLPKVVLTALLLGGGSSLLFAGSAQANQRCTWDKIGGFICPNPVILGDKSFDNFAFDVTDPDGLQDITATIDFVWNQVGAPGFQDDTWTVDVDMTEGAGGDVVGPANGFFTYDVAVTDPDWQFATAKHDTLNLSGASLSTKLVDYAGGQVQLVSLNGAPDGPVAIGGTFISVSDTWSVNTDGDSIDNFTNTFTQRQQHHVPGPLPLLGAGAAFGFSRRLRSRIKASRLA
jgi:hypothetical protein